MWRLVSLELKEIYVRGISNKKRKKKKSNKTLYKFCLKQQNAWKVSGHRNGSLYDEAGSNELGGNLYFSSHVVSCNLVVSYTQINQSMLHFSNLLGELLLSELLQAESSKTVPKFSPHTMPCCQVLSELHVYWCHVWLCVKFHFSCLHYHPFRLYFCELH